MAKILVDMDAVIVDFISPLLTKYNNKYKADLKVNDITQWTLPKDMRAIYEDNYEFFLDLLPIPYALDGVNHLKKYHDVLICTDSGNSFNVAKAKVKWCKLRLPEIPVIITNDKTMPCDVIIEDAPHHLDNANAKLKICVSWPWNEKMSGLRVIPGTNWWIDNVVNSLITKAGS